MAEKVRFELRFDEDVYSGLKKLAEGAEISLNQLMQGLSRWAVANGHGGEPERSSCGYQISSVEQPGVVWFGETDAQHVVDDRGDPDVFEPTYHFSLDFTERRVVREDLESPLRKANK